MATYYIFDYRWFYKFKRASGSILIHNAVSILFPVSENFGKPARKILWVVERWVWVLSWGDYGCLFDLWHCLTCFLLFYLAILPRSTLLTDQFFAAVFHQCYISKNLGKFAYCLGEISSLLLYFTNVTI